MKTVLFLCSFLFVLVVGANSARGMETGDVTFLFETPITYVVKDENLRVISFESDKVYFDEKQSEILPKLTDAINKGWYDVVEVRTTYSAGYLTSAEITYNDDFGGGGGKRVGLMILTSNLYTIGQKAEQLNPKLERATKWEWYYYRYGVAAVNPVYVRGHLVAFEVYYWKWKNQ